MAAVPLRGRRAALGPGAAGEPECVLENHGSKGISQPCPRCVAGESGHFSHILGP
ncbi:uncharacterized protein C10orf143 homolog [Ammospiza maritima maritima]